MQKKLCAVRINNQKEFDEPILNLKFDQIKKHTPVKSPLQVAEEKIKSIKNHLRVAPNSPFTLEELLSDYYKTLETLER